MFQPEDPTAPAELQINPMRGPYFRLFQPAGQDKWVEVGVVWTIGTSKTNAIEYWYLFDSVPADNPALGAYKWLGYGDDGRIYGTNLRFQPATPPAEQNANTLPDYLQRTMGVRLTAVRAMVYPLVEELSGPTPT